MPKAFFWLVLSTKGENADRASKSCVFDDLAAAQAYLKETGHCVMLGGKTAVDAVSRSFSRLDEGSVIRVKCILPRNLRGPKELTVPSRGPVTIEEKRLVRALQKEKASSLKASTTAAAAAAAAAAATSEAAAPSSSSSASALQSGGKRRRKDSVDEEKEEEKEEEELPESKGKVEAEVKEEERAAKKENRKSKKEKKSAKVEDS